MSPLRFYRELRRRFYDGPAVFNYPGRRIKGYRSPNLLIALWAQAFGAIYFTQAGFFMLALSGVILMTASVSLEMPLYYFAFALCSLYLAAVVIGWWYRPRVRLTRVVPESAPVRSPIRIDYVLTNVGRRPAWQVMIDTMALPRWLTRPEPLALVDHLPPGGVLGHTGHLVAAKRGEYLLPLPAADSAFPFGLWRWGTRGEPNKPLIVYPEYAPLAAVRLPIGQRYQPGHRVTALHQGTAIEFHGCREYRYGDNPRHLHALSSARLRQPIVKEFRDEYMTRVAILLDTYPPPQPAWVRALRREHPGFEAGLSLTAATVEYMIRQDFRVEFFALGKPPLRGGGGRGTGFLQVVLNLLAGIQPSQGDFPGIPEDLVREMGQISAAVVVLLQWRPDREEVVNALRAAGIATRVVLVSPVLGDFPRHADYVQVMPEQVRRGAVTTL